jgi:hypothetical protein
MPPILQGPNLAEIQAQCGLEPLGVIRLHGGIGGGWARYERILPQTTRATGGSVLVLTGLIVEFGRHNRAARGRNWLVAAITFSGDPTQAGCLYERLDNPIVGHSMGNAGCTEPETPGASPAFCP